MVIVHSIKSLQETFEARASEWMLAWATVNLSLVMFLNEGLFEQPALFGLRDLINSQLVWGWIFLIVGVSRFSVLIINGAYWRTPHFRAATAFFCSGVWFMLAVGFVQNGSFMIAILPPLFFLDAYNVKRASREAGTREYLQRYKKEQINAGKSLAGLDT